MSAFVLKHLSLFRVDPDFGSMNVMFWCVFERPLFELGSVILHYWSGSDTISHKREK